MLFLGFTLYSWLCLVNLSHELPRAVPTVFVAVTVYDLAP